MELLTNNTGHPTTGGNHCAAGKALDVLAVTSGSSPGHSRHPFCIHKVKKQCVFAQTRAVTRVVTLVLPQYGEKVEDSGMNINTLTTIQTTRQKTFFMGL